MIAAIIRWSLQQRWLIIGATLLLLVLGVMALKHTPVDAIPDLSDVQVIIKTHYPGQSPQVVEDQVTYPIASAMLAVPGVTTVRAFSFFGDSYVYVLFKDGTDLYWARSRVLEYLSQLSGRLPPNAKPQLGPDATGVGWIYQYALIDRTGQHDLAQLTSLQNWFLRYQLQAIPGVAEVATIGGMVKQYQVILYPNKLRAYGISVAQVRKAIAQANQEVGGGVLELGEGEYMISVSGYIKNIQAIKDTPLGVSASGTPIFVKNVAAVRLGPQSRRGIAELNGKGEVVGGVIVMRSGANALSTIQAVKLKLAQLQKNLPKGVKIVETYNRAGLISRAIHSLKIKLIIEALIVIFICFIFLLHFRSSLIIVISLPIGILAAYIVMYWQGINANIMSLGGLAIAIGAMVDASMVMIENVHKTFESHVVTAENRWSLISQAAVQVGPPLFYSLLIITLSFIPVFGLQAQEGRMFSPLAFTKSYAMAAAAGLSITLVPVLMGAFIRGKLVPEQRNPINRFFTWLYQPVLSMTLRFPKSVLSIAVVLVLVSAWPVLHLGMEFMPTLDEGDWLYMPSTLPGVSVGKARHILQQTDKLIKTVPEVKTVFGKVGRAETATDPAPLTMIESVIQFKPKSQWRPGMTMAKIKAQLRERLQIPGLTPVFVMPIKNRIDMLTTGVRTPLGIKISGPKLTTVQHIAKQVARILEKLPGTASAFAERAVGGRYINVDINRQAAARYGLSIAAIQNVIRTAVGGANITQTVEGVERYPVNLRYPQAYRDSLAKLKLLPLITPTGAHIPLADVAKLSIGSGPPMIKSENARIAAWVHIDLKHLDLGGYLTRAKKALATQLRLPPGYTLTWGGQHLALQRVQARLGMLVPLTLVIILLLLYANFKSVVDVLIILTTLPLALLGGVWFLYALGYHWSVAVVVGFIALAGVVVEIGVVMLVYLHAAYEKRQPKNNDEIKQAIFEGALRRLRPILMTVFAIIGGLLPIMLWGGTGIEVTRRIVAPVIGGMVSATILTLIVLPAVFILVKRHSQSNKLTLN